MAKTAADISRREKKMIYINSKRNVPCVDCGQTFPEYCMDFHHKDPSTKNEKGKQSIKNRMKHYSDEKINVELEKFVVLCACCHRIRHHSGR